MHCCIQQLEQYLCKVYSVFITPHKICILSDFTYQLLEQCLVVLSLLGLSLLCDIEVILISLSISHCFDTCHSHPEGRVELFYCINTAHKAMLPADADTDDPSDTSQVRYMPAARNKRQVSSPTVIEENILEGATLAVEPAEASIGVAFPRTETPACTSTAAPIGKRLSVWGLISLSISMAGAQIAWSVELGSV